VVDTVEQTYEIPMVAPGRQLVIIPIGMPGAGRLVTQPIEAPHAGGTRYLFVGRMEARKGMIELGQAFAQVAQRDPQACLWIVGADNSGNDGFAARTGKSYPQAMKALWGESIASRVHFFGRISDEEKNDLYAQCDVLVAPSRYESFGMMYLEAMRYGKPTIGTNVGGVPEVVLDGVTGLLVPPEAPDRLAEAMLTLGANPDLRRRMGVAGLRRFEESFSLYSLGRQTENFYWQVLDDWHGWSGRAPRLPEPAATIPFRPAVGRRVA
jgi:glycosyltransferase involved in cell wall biosynthesis